MKDNIVGIRIRQLREKEKLSQAKLSKSLGDLKQPVLARYELGAIMPSYSMLIKIADYFDVSLDYLLGRTDNPAGKLYGQSNTTANNIDDFVEMCFDSTTTANAKLKQALKSLLSEQHNN